MEVICYERYHHYPRQSTRCFYIPEEKILLQFTDYGYSMKSESYDSASLITGGPCYEEAQRVADGKISYDETIKGLLETSIINPHTFEYPTEKVKAFLADFKAQKELEQKTRDLAFRVRGVLGELSDLLPRSE